MKLGWVTATLAALALSGASYGDPCHADLPSQGTEFHGTVTHIIDGDGFCVGEADGGIEVRLGDFYAPELDTPAGKHAREVLSGLALGRSASCQAGRQSYDRVVADCVIDGARVGDAMRAAGVPEGGRGTRRK